MIQYRAKESSGSEWTEWRDLPMPGTLAYSDYYHPHYFEFRELADVEASSIHIHVHMQAAA